MARPPLPTRTALTIHNLSTFEFSQQDLELLNKGLSFAPTPRKSFSEQQTLLLRHYDNFAKSVHRTYTKLQYRRPNTELPYVNPPLCAQVYRTIKFYQKKITQRSRSMTTIPAYTKLNIT